MTLAAVTATTMTAVNVLILRRSHPTKLTPPPTTTTATTTTSKPPPTPPAPALAKLPSPMLPCNTSCRCSCPFLHAPSPAGLTASFHSFHFHPHPHLHSTMCPCSQAIDATNTHHTDVSPTQVKPLATRTHCQFTSLLAEAFACVYPLLHALQPDQCPLRHATTSRSQ